MASVLKVDKLDPQSGTALEIGTSGDTISLPSGATLDISASTLTPPATMPASSGANLTALDAGNISAGTLPVARGGTNITSGFVNGDTIQRVTSSQTTGAGSTTSSWADTGLTASITPAATANKVLITVHQNSTGITNTSSQYSGVRLRLMRDTTVIATMNEGCGYRYSASVANDVGSASITWLDAPSSTSSLAYHTEFSMDGGYGTGQVQWMGRSTIMLEEVIL